MTIDAFLESETRNFTWTTCYCSTDVSYLLTIREHAVSVGTNDHQPTPTADEPFIHLVTANVQNESQTSMEIEEKCLHGAELSTMDSR